MTQPRPRSHVHAAALTAAALLAAAPVAAQLPAADSLVARHVAAIGGEAAARRLASTRSAGTLAMPALGLTGRIAVLGAAPARMVVRITLPGFGEIHNGFDGAVGWEVNPLQGARLLEGAEAERMREDADFHGDLLRAFPAVVARETVERAEAEGAPCWKVRVTWRSGRETFECYDAASGLLSAAWSTQTSPMGSLETTTTFGDYRAVGGVRLASRVRQRAGGQEQLITITEVTVNDVRDDELAAPAPVVALRARAAAPPGGR